MGELIGADDPSLGPSTDVAVALDQLDQLGPLDASPGQAADRDRIIRLASEASGRLADRTWRPGHLTGSALVVDAAGERIALLFHTKLSKWLQPGGHADGDTNLMGVALREATEETGIEGLRVDPEPLDVDIHEVRPPAEDPHLHLDLRFLVVAPEGAELVGNHESTDLRWVGWDELDDYQPDPSLRRLADAALRRRGGSRTPPCC